MRALRASNCSEAACLAAKLSLPPLWAVVALEPIRLASWAMTSGSSDSWPADDEWRSLYAASRLLVMPRKCLLDCSWATWQKLCITRATACELPLSLWTAKEMSPQQQECNWAKVCMPRDADIPLNTCTCSLTGPKMVASSLTAQTWLSAACSAVRNAARPELSIMASRPSGLVAAIAARQISESCTAFPFTASASCRV